VQIGITVVSATSAVYGGEFIAGQIASALRRAGVGDSAEELSFALVVALISYLSLVLGELVPKSLALRHADRYSTAIARPLLWLSFVMRPLVWLLTKSSNLVLRVFGDHTSFTEARVSREELRHLVDEAAKTGSIDQPSSEIAARAIAFGDVTVGQLMVPRSEIAALPRGASAEDVRRVLLEQGHSRMPVYEGTPDHIVGYIVAKDVLALAWEQPLVILEDILRPVHFVPQKARAASALRALQRRHMQLAIVLGAHREVVGLVTIEDLVEEVVGEIFSEDEPEPIRPQGDGTILVDGTVPVREINRELGLEIPAGDNATIADLLVARLGGGPRPGASAATEDGVVLEVVAVIDEHVALVRLHLSPGEGSTTAEPDTGG
jgi:putative hemolysin